MDIEIEVNVDSNGFNSATGVAEIVADKQTNDSPTDVGEIFNFKF